MKLKNAVIPIIAVNIAMYILQLSLGRWFTELFLLDSSIWIAEPWRLLTSMFLHGGPGHLLINMYVLFMFGTLIENRIGTKRFLTLYFISGLLASFAATFFYDLALGASGAIMGVIGITIMLLPNLQVLFFFVIPMSMRTAGIIIAALDIFAVLPGVAHAAHLAGLATGLAYGYMLLGKKKQYLQRMHSRPRRSGRRSDYQESIEMTPDEVNDFLKNGRL